MPQVRIWDCTALAHASSCIERGKWVSSRDSAGLYQSLSIWMWPKSILGQLLWFARVYEGNFLNTILFFSILHEVVYIMFFFPAGPHVLTIAVFTLTGIVILVLIISLLILRYQPLWLSVCLSLNSFPARTMPWSVLEEPFISLPYIPVWLSLVNSLVHAK